MTNQPLCILGIDPGTNFLGYGVLEVISGEIRIAESGVLTMAHLENPSEKLQRIFERVSQLIARFQPQSMAIEAPFFGKNIQSMLKLGRAQGVAIAASLAGGIPFTEYAPRRVKQAITGKGGATKDQVAAMLEQILRQPIRHQMTEDASDALAVALCHYYQLTRKVGTNGTGGSGWSAFMKKNPDRILG
jgi:crossover junction endodeoxyribonuclease RuvC